MWYVDTSALAKLVRPELETPALRRWLGRRTWVISDLHRTELRRVAMRAGGRAAERAELLLAECTVISIDADIYDGAGRRSPATLRAIDALHLEAAMALGPDLSGMVVYDDRLRRAAESSGLATAAPTPANA